MAKLSLRIDNGVRMDFRQVVDKVECIRASANRLRNGCRLTQDNARRLGVKMQTAGNDTAQRSVNQAVDQLAYLDKELRDLQDSADDLVRKLRRLEEFAAQ